MVKEVLETRRRTRNYSQRDNDDAISNPKEQKEDQVAKSESFGIKIVPHVTPKRLQLFLS